MSWYLIPVSNEIFNGLHGRRYEVRISYQSDIHVNGMNHLKSDENKEEYLLLLYSYLYSRQKPVQSQQNNVRTTFSERCSNVILLTLNRFLPTGKKENVVEQCFRVVKKLFTIYV